MTNENFHTTLASSLRDLAGKPMNWVDNNTAIIIMHGIGNALPLETVDTFARGIIYCYRDVFGPAVTLEHVMLSKECKQQTWYDNVIRIKHANSSYHIDIYEYYWADLAEDKATWNDMNSWLRGVVRGAKIFYDRNAMFGKEYKDKSPFFDSDTGEFITWKYNFFLTTMSRLFMAVDITTDGLIKFLSFIPFLGGIAAKLLKSKLDSSLHNITNVIGDVVVYNVTDPKSKFYSVRRAIRNGALDALRYLIEKPDNPYFSMEEEKELLKKNSIHRDAYREKLEDQSPAYPNVIVAGHSLGSQVAYDAINSLNNMMNQGEISNYDRRGKCLWGKRSGICNQLKGFITFGSPLDKIIFFLRENVPYNQYLRQQLLDQFHSFKIHNPNKRNNESTNKNYVPLEPVLKSLFDDVQWRNYYDNKDYISGGLDYYGMLTNIDCRFKAGKMGFTHSNYWDCKDFYEDIIFHFLQPQP